MKKKFYTVRGKIAGLTTKENIKSQDFIIADKTIGACVTNQDIIKPKLYNISFSHEYKTKK